MRDSVSWEFVRPEDPPGVMLVGKYVILDDKPAIQQEHHSEIKVALLDLNKTLIVSKSGSAHGVDENDWKWWDSGVPAKLRELYAEGYVIVLTSNQGRFTDKDGNNSSEATPFQKKLRNVMKSLGVPATVMLGCANDMYRKPRPGIWSLVPSQTGHDQCSINKSKSFVVGDAAGRQDDHSDSDRHLAENLGLDFFVPETFFRGEEAGPICHKFQPSWHFKPAGEIEDELVRIGHKDHTTQIVTVLIGLPGAGKTTYYRRHLEPFGYARIGKSAEEDWRRSAESANELLSEGRSIVVDELNVDEESRAIWISIARRRNIQVRALYFRTPVELCLHNDSMRALVSHLNTEKKPIYPRILFLELASRLKEPHTQEGFADVKNVDFAWYGTKEYADIWIRHWN